MNPYDEAVDDDDIGAGGAPSRATRLAAAGAVVVVLAASAVILLSRDHAQPVSTGTADRLVELAQLIPDGLTGGGWIHLVDYEGGRELAGVPRPAPDAPAAEQDAYFEDLGIEEYWPHHPVGELVANDRPFEAVREELGIDLAQVTAAGQWGEPPDTVIVMVGHFDPQRVDGAARTLPEPWGEALEVAEHRGVTYYSWFEDGVIDVSRAIDTNRLGRGRRLAIVDDHLVITASTNAMVKTIDAILDRSPSPASELARQAPRPPDHFALTLWTGESELAELALPSWEPGEGPDDDPRFAHVHVAVSVDPGEAADTIEAQLLELAADERWSTDMTEAVDVSVQGDIVTISIEWTSVTGADDPDRPGIPRIGVMREQVLFSVLSLDAPVS